MRRISRPKKSSTRFTWRETMQSDTEISKALARAIGWERTNLLLSNKKSDLKQCWAWAGWHWKVFDYRDPAVIWPIAERYGLFPSSISTGDYQAAEKQGHGIHRGWECVRWHYEKIKGKTRGWVIYKADTAAKAVALAVIGGNAPK